MEQPGTPELLNIYFLFLLFYLEICYLSINCVIIFCFVHVLRTNQPIVHYQLLARCIIVSNRYTHMKVLKNVLYIQLLYKHWVASTLQKLPDLDDVMTQFKLNFFKFRKFGGRTRSYFSNELKR